MKKILLFLLIGVISFLNLANSVKAETQIPKQSGLNLDIARRFYNVDKIKDYIDLLNANDADFLHLHFSDDQNYAIESDILHQTVENAIEIDGVYYNVAPSKFNPERFDPRPFLSSEQVLEISEYANQKGIELIPELDSPGHMWGIRDLFTFNDMDESIFHANELQLFMPEARTFIKNLWYEAMQVFPYSERIHLGGDEFTHNFDTQLQYASYVNELTDYLIQEFDINKTIIWNDLIRESNVDLFNSNIQVSYWMYSDWSTGEVLEFDRITLPDLLSKGFEVYNYNGYYLYFVPSERSMTEESILYRENDMNNPREIIEIPDNLLGSVISIWGEDSANYTLDEIYDAIDQQIIDMINMNKNFSQNKLVETVD